MACCDKCEKSGGSCGGGQGEAAKKLYSGGYEYAPVPGSLTCPTCRYYAWSDGMTPVLDVGGGCHHPSCGSVWDIDRNWFPPSRGDGGAGLGAYVNTGGGGAPRVPWQGARVMLTGGQQLLLGQSLVSPNGKFFFVLQGDGNLVSKTRTGFVIWAAGTNGRGVVRAVMQQDGNFVLYNARWQAIWSTGTANQPNALIQQQDDGNVVLYGRQGKLWSTFSQLPFPDLSISVAGVPRGVGATTMVSEGGTTTVTTSNTLGWVVGGLAVAAVGAAVYEMRKPRARVARARRRKAA